MEVWLLVWEYPDEIEHNETVWADELSALQQACSEIQEKVNKWDMDDDDQINAADIIEAERAKGTLEGYRASLNAWNEYQDNYNSDYGEWYSILKKDVLGGNGPITERAIPVATYKASTPGATCRGPCKQYNEYAYADRPDGTHMCRQCSTFQSIFGVKP